MKITEIQDIYRNTGELQKYRRVTEIRIFKEIQDHYRNTRYIQKHKIYTEIQDNSRNTGKLQNI